VSEDEDRFADYNAEQAEAARSQYPVEWTDAGVTTEPVQLGEGIVIGPAAVYTAPVENPIFEAIDRASEDRTPVLETTVGLGDSWVRFQKSLADAMASFAETIQTAAESLQAAGGKLAALEQIYGPLTPPRRQVALLGTGKRRHKHPGKLCPCGGHRAEHARARRLYSERLRRDRRRIRKGRAPILRSSTFEAVIPRAQVNVTKAGPELAGMEIVAHPWVPEDQAWIIDPSILDGYQFTEPKDLDADVATWRSSWRGRWMSTLELYSRGFGYGEGLTKPGSTHRATNYIIQADAAEREAAGIQGHTPRGFWVDETADVDRWLDDGGADHG